MSTNNNSNNNTTSRLTQSPSQNTRSRAASQGNTTVEEEAAAAAAAAASTSTTSASSNNNNNNTNNNTTTANGKSDDRFHFPFKIEDRKFVEGNFQFDYPFIKNDNPHDLVLAQIIWQHKPYLPPDKLVKWAKVTAQLKQQKDSAGNNLYPNSLGYKAASGRLKKFLDWYVRKNNQVPFQSGCDDEEEESELERVISDIATEKESFDTGTANARAHSARQAQVNRENATAIQNAALGNYRSRGGGTLPTPSSGRGSNRRNRVSNGVEEAPDSGASGGSRSSSRKVVDLTTAGSGMTKVLEQQLELGKKREETMKEQLDLDKSRTANEKQRIDNDTERLKQDQVYKKRELELKSEEVELAKKKFKTESDIRKQELDVQSNIRTQELELRKQETQTLQQTMSSMADVNQEMIKTLGKIMDKMGD